jgi:hypothetical protein
MGAEPLSKQAVDLRVVSSKSLSLLVGSINLLTSFAYDLHHLRGEV